MGVDSEQLELWQAEARAKETASLAKEVQELQEIQQEITKLVDAQAEDLDQIEDNVANANMNQEEAKKELVNAANHRVSRGFRRVSTTLGAATTGIAGGIVFHWAAP